MTNSCPMVSLVICATMLVMSSSTMVNAGGNHHHHHNLGWLPIVSSCKGSTAEYLSTDEFDLDSEINRRILTDSGYISYGALKGDRVPCSQRGASYYNCQPGAQANPYDSGCSAITRCRG